MRVLYVCKRFPKYSETFIRNEVRSLIQKGVDVRVVSLEHPHRGDPSVDGIGDLRGRITYLGKAQRADIWNHLRGPRRNWAWLLRCIWWTIRTRDAAHLRRWREAGAIATLTEARSVERLHAHFAHGPASTAMIAADLLRIPFSFTAHARDLYELTPPWMLRYKSRRASFVVAVGEAHRNYLVDLGIPSGKVKVVHNGVSSTVRWNGPRQRHGAPTIVSVARFVPKKGHDVLLEALALLTRRGIDFQARLIGGGSLHKSLVSLARELGLEGRVEIVGWVSETEVVEELASADVFALASRITLTGDRDGLPVALVEAMASGLPIVSTQVSAIPEAVEHGEEGFLVRPDDPDALASALEKLLIDEPLRESLGERARHRAERDFSAPSSASALMELFARAKSP